jgi:glucosylceramidase
MMNATTREEFLTAYWDADKGLGYTVHRVPINSPDFAVKTFSEDDVPDDFALAHFDDNLTYDRVNVIPLARAAQARSKEPLLFFGSPWSPPAWMKTNNNMISSDDPCLKADTPQGSYAGAWAAYFVRWVKAMAAAGVPMWGVTVQNVRGAAAGVEAWVGSVGAAPR